MQTKHTFLFTLILGLVWAGLLFGYQNGPDPASNGIFGQAACNASGCHVGNPLNASGGSTTLAGLPSEWTPGQTYQLTVTVARSSSAKYGFQLSAVTDSTNAQAGSFTPGSNRVSVVTSAGVQYAQHNQLATTLAPFTGVFNVNWTAPASASAGSVRFNLAGNAANGNVQSTGDFIYTLVERRSPAIVIEPPPVTFMLPNLSGMSRLTDGAGANIDVGYGRILPSAGNTTPSGVSIFGFHQSNVLVTEAGVPASPLIRTGRIYAEVGGAVNTGLAIANPNSQAANITFSFTNSAGVDFGGGSLVLGANQQTAKFLNEDPFNGGSSVQGSFTFSSDAPVSVVALRGFTNERGEFLITTLPVVNLDVPATTATTYLPHFAAGAGWTTQIILVNPTDGALSGSIQFMGQGSETVAAAPVTLTANGTAASSFSFAIPRRGSFKLVTTSPPAISTGSVRITSAQGSVSPTSLVVFSYKPGAFTVSEAGVQGIRGNAHRLYVEVNSAGTSAGTIQTGFAVANVGQSNSTLNLELFRLDGTSTGLTRSVTLPASGQIARFVHELFPTLPIPFQGVLRISGASAGASVVGLRGRYNERGDFLVTTTPPSDEGSAPSAGEMLFPHLVNGGGYTTQLVLFSGSAGQSTNGTIGLFGQSGTALNLTLN